MQEIRKSNARDVAELAQVSQTTVSRVFSNNPHVKASVRQHVMDAAKKLNYSPHKPGAGNTFVLAIPLRFSYYYSAIQEGIRVGMSGKSYALEITDIYNIEFFSPARIAGIITVNDLKLLPSELQHRLRSSEIPLLTINQELDKIPSVSSDHATGIEMAVDHFVENGHKAIACIIHADDGPLETLNFAKRERIKGYQEAMKKNGIEYDRKMIFMTSETRLVESIAVALNRGATAIIMAEEGYGLFLQYALTLLNRKVPENVSVISYEVSYISSYLQPAQTTIDQDAFVIGKFAAQRMIAMIENTDDFPLHVRLPNRFHLRDSVASVWAV